MKRRRQIPTSSVPAPPPPAAGSDAPLSPPVASARVTEFISRDQRSRLGELLVAGSALTAEQLSAALNLQQASGRQLGSVLVDQGLVDPRTLCHALAAQVGLPTIDLRTEAPEADALELVPEHLARALRLLPMRITDGTLHVALADTADEAVREVLAGLPVAEVALYLAPSDEVDASITRSYRILTDADESVREAWERAPRFTAETADLGIDVSTPVVQLVNKILEQAARDRASDVHIEPTEDHLRIRFRVDGAMREALRLPSGTGPELISRIKILSDMDIVERRRPQDGQFTVNAHGHDIDVRVATAATIWGETAVLRLLDTRRKLVRLQELGMHPSVLESYREVVSKPHGMLLCSGPTGSGKTTTLYATLSDIIRPEINVMTIEDPVEYVFPDANQLQINLAAGVTFAEGLRSCLRRDPDVVLVGEIRDQETARIAVQSSLTGHFVMSSVHATDASGAVYRMLDLGVEPYLVGSAVIGVIGQRLVRRICESCAEPYEPSSFEREWYERVEWLVRSPGQAPKSEFVRGRGCNFCGGSGFRDRVGVYELLRVNDEIRELVIAKATPQVVREAAIRNGMRTMAQQAAALVAADATTIDEVLRNVYVG